MRQSGSPINWTRREMLRRMGGGFGILGLAGVLAEEMGPSVGAASDLAKVNPLAPKLPHFGARAKRVIFLFMNGGPSHVDTFDPKPMLAKHQGDRPPAAVKTGRRNAGGLMSSPFVFHKCGQSGIEVSEIFPEIGKCIDEVCVI